MGYKKDIFSILRMDSNSYTNHGEAVHVIRRKTECKQHEVLYVIKLQEGLCTAMP